MTIKHIRLILDKLEEKLKAKGLDTESENSCKIVNIEYESEQSVCIEYRPKQHKTFVETERNLLETIIVKLNKTEMKEGFK
jgi:hypothetical protein